MSKDEVRKNLIEYGKDLAFRNYVISYMTALRGSDYVETILINWGREALIEAYLYEITKHEEEANMTKLSILDKLKIRLTVFFDNVILKIKTIFNR